MKPEDHAHSQSGQVYEIRATAGAAHGHPGDGGVMQLGRAALAHLLVVEAAALFICIALAILEGGLVALPEGIAVWVVGQFIILPIAMMRVLEMNRDHLAPMLCFPAFLGGSISALVVIQVVGILGIENGTHPVLASPVGVLVFTLFGTPLAGPAFYLFAAGLRVAGLHGQKTSITSGALTGLLLCMLILTFAEAPSDKAWVSSILSWLIGGAVAGAAFDFLDRHAMTERS